MLKNTEKFKKILNESYSWPDKYNFKFIVPFMKVNDLEKVLGDKKLTKKASKKGSFVSVTVVVECSCAEDVLEIYDSVSHIEGIISL